MNPEQRETAREIVRVVLLLCVLLLCAFQVWCQYRHELAVIQWRAEIETQLDRIEDGTNGK